MTLFCNLFIERPSYYLTNGTGQRHSYNGRLIGNSIDLSKSIIPNDLDDPFSCLNLFKSSVLYYGTVTWERIATIYCPQVPGSDSWCTNTTTMFSRSRKQKLLTQMRHAVCQRHLSFLVVADCTCTMTNNSVHWIGVHWIAVEYGGRDSRILVVTPHSTAVELCSLHRVVSTPEIPAFWMGCSEINKTFVFVPVSIKKKCHRYLFTTFWATLFSHTHYTHTHTHTHKERERERERERSII